MNPSPPKKKAKKPLPQPKPTQPKPTPSNQTLFPTPPPSHLLCPICMDFYYIKIIQQCSQGHVLCISCFYRLPIPRKCPSCRMLLTDNRNRVLEELAQNYPMQCKWRDCKHVCAAKDFCDHKVKCKNKASDCVVVGCDWEGYKDEIEAHCMEKHPDIVKKKMPLEPPRKIRWELGASEWMKEDGTYIVIDAADGHVYGIYWRTSDDEEVANQVHIRVYPFIHGTRTKFVLTVVDGDDWTYILKANTQFEDCSIDNDSNPPSLSIPKTRFVKRYMTIEFV